VTPIFKKGTKGDPENYRPVSLASVPCKMLESIMKDRLMNHLLENKLIGESQHGFMPGKSCAMNLVELMDFVTEAVDKRKSVDIFYLDFSKAFDKVPHQRLLKKMEAKGVEIGAVKWIENWLSDRSQYAFAEKNQKTVLSILECRKEQCWAPPSSQYTLMIWSRS
jgi:hypothetical protein